MNNFRYKHGRIFWQEYFYVCEACGRSSRKAKHTYLVTCRFCQFTARAGEHDLIHPGEMLSAGEPNADYFMGIQKRKPKQEIHKSPVVT